MGKKLNLNIAQYVRIMTELQRKTSKKGKPVISYITKLENKNLKQKKIKKLLKKRTLLILRKQTKRRAKSFCFNQ